MTLTQLDLPPYTARFRSQRRQFDDFHAANPHVYDALVRLARKWRAAGHARASMDMFFHILRWEYGLETRGDDFKLNNNYTAHYARMIEEREFGMRGFFTKRRQRAV